MLYPLLYSATIYDSDFYVISRNSTTGKGLLLPAWNTTAIKENCNNKIVFEYRDVLQYANMPDVAIFHITSLIYKERVQAFKDTANRTIDDITTQLCVMDIDDQALNPESELYDPMLANSDHRYELSNKILQAIGYESMEYNDNSNSMYSEITKSTKGFHIVLCFGEETLPILNCKKLKLTDRACTKHGITEQERKRADIDLLLMHQIKKAGQPLKLTIQHYKDSRFYLPIPDQFLEREKKIEFNLFAGGEPPRPRNFKYVTDPNYRKYEPIQGAFRRYLQSIGIEVPAGKQVLIPCVFHGETKASLSIDTERNLYHCFGCNAGGSLADFIMQQRGVKFKDAVNILNELGLLK